MNPPKRADAGAHNARCSPIFAVSLPGLDRRTAAQRLVRTQRLPFSVSILAFLIAGLCTPALAENKTYDSDPLQNTPLGFSPSSSNSFGPTGYTSIENNVITIDYDSNTSPTSVFGGFSDSGNVTGNEVRLIRGAVDYGGGVYGGYSNGGNAANNTVTASDHAHVNNGGVYGGYSVSGAAANNTVSMSDHATFNAVGVYGGLSGNSYATDNTVTMSGDATIVGFVYGGAGFTGATGNTVSMGGNASVSGNVVGGYSNGGSTTNNTVNMDGNAHVGGNVTGGLSSGNGNATGNTVSISGDATVSGAIYGGYSDGGNTTDNIVTVSGDAHVNNNNVYGGRSQNGIATGNIVNISGGRVDEDVFGGFGDGSATGNIVTISGGSIGGVVRGGNSNGAATGNVVTVSGDVTAFGVTGGSSNSGNAAGNTVTISGNATTPLVHGGLSYAGSAIGNTVIISSGSFGGIVYGGTALGGTSNDTATGNTVIIHNGSANTVVGGFNGVGDATDNTVEIRGGSVTNAIRGGMSAGEARRGNTLHINNWRGSTQAAIANFENYRFTLPASAIGSGDAVLTTSGNVDLGSNANVSTHFTGIPAAALRVGQQAILISTSDPMSGSVSGTSFSQSTLGATDYTFDVALENGDTALVATLAGKEVNQNKAGTYLYGASARLAALTSGADHVVSLLDNWQHSPQTPTSAGFRSFVSIQGSSIKTRTGSSVNNNGVSFALGGAFDTATRLGTLTMGIFAEGGIGSYDSYSRFGWGDGDTWHYGIGAFAKHAFTNHLYLEGSVRAGRAKADFDGKGSVSDLHYNSEGNYWGAHAGVGIDYPLTNVSSMDTYAKLLWTHQDSDAVTTHAKERLSFDSADSLRSRIGTRYRHRVEENLRAHVGVGWEYEFDGKARAKLDGTKIAHEPETQGHSALIEAGIEWRATKSWSVNANATAMGGQRKGLSGYAQATYRF